MTKLQLETSISALIRYEQFINTLISTAPNKYVAEGWYEELENTRTTRKEFVKELAERDAAETVEIVEVNEEGASTGLSDNT